MASILVSIEQPAILPETRRALWMIFIVAVALRWSYDIALFATMGQNGLTGGDSHRYLGIANSLVTNWRAGTLYGWAWLGSDFGVMPIYPWLIALNLAAFGALGHLATVMEQGLIDAGTCIIVFMLARLVGERIAIPAAIAAALNPTQIVLSGYLYTDTAFLFFVALFLYAAVSWLRSPSWRTALILGFALGLGALVRSVIVPWVPVLCLILLAMSVVIGQIRFRCIIQLAAAAAIVGLCLAPILVRNVTQYGAWALTSQAGTHLAFWIAPLVREAKDGTPWERGSSEMSKLVTARYGRAPSNQFLRSEQYTQIGREELAKLGFRAIAKAWLVGAAINIGSPAIIISPPIAKLPRTGFFATRGDSTTEKIANFLFHSDSAIYAWALLLGIAGVVVVRLAQLVGLFALMRERKHWPIIILFGLWVGFILAANGPVASPKYRLPIEPVLCVLTGAAITLLRDRRKRLHARLPDNQDTAYSRAKASVA
jgi:4-amino-4-deoxy-L-arabinose transferase-like glycosyltransferase